MDKLSNNMKKLSNNMNNKINDNYVTLENGVMVKLSSYIHNKHSKNYMEITGIIHNSVEYTIDEFKKMIREKLETEIEKEKNQYIKDNINKKIPALSYMKTDIKEIKQDNSKMYYEFNLEDLAKDEIKLVIHSFNGEYIVYNIKKDTFKYYTNHYNKFEKLISLKYKSNELNNLVILKQLENGNNVSKINQQIYKFNQFVKNKKSVRLVVGNKEVKTNEIYFRRLFLDYSEEKIKLDDDLKELNYKSGDDITVKNGNKSITLNFEGIEHIK